MRPRVFPAEDALPPPCVLPCSNASMRPRVFPAEDELAPRGLCIDAHLASMRPRVFPAEDPGMRRRIPAPTTSFNEAAGIPRGRLRFRDRFRRRYGASMRPRVFPAEDAVQRNLVEPLRHASMRPRVFPAEDSGHAQCQWG